MPRSTRVLIAALAVLPAAFVQVMPIDDLDVWWLLKTGEHMVSTGSFPRSDPFSWTAAGAPWVNHAWGFELILHGAHRLGGLDGLVVLPAVFALATFAVMYATLRRTGLPASGAVLSVWLAALLTRGFWSPRPQLVTYLGLAILWAIVTDYREGRANRLWWLPPLVAVWANLHGGFFIALAVLGLATAGLWLDRLAPVAEDPGRVPRIGPMAAAWVASAVAALLNPFHIHALTFPLEVVADRTAKDFILEWSSPAFQYPQLRPFEAVLLFVLVALPAIRRLRLGDALVLLAFLHLAFDATRNIPLFVIVLLPLIGRLGAAMGDRLREAVATLGRAGRPRAVVAAGLVVLLPLGLLRDLGALRPGSLWPRAGVADVFPAAAADRLLAQPLPGPMFNDYGWGGYLTWRLYPRYRVFMDGRVAIYPSAVREDFLAINSGWGGWREALERRGVRLVVIRRGTVLAGLLREAPEWAVAYEDRLAVIFTRRSGPST